MDGGAVGTNGRGILGQGVALVLRELCSRSDSVAARALAPVRMRHSGTWRDHGGCLAIRSAQPVEQRGQHESLRSTASHDLDLGTPPVAHPAGRLNEAQQIGSRSLPHGCDQVPGLEPLQIRGQSCIIDDDALCARRDLQGSGQSRSLGNDLQTLPVCFCESPWIGERRGRCPPDGQRARRCRLDARARSIRRPTTRIGSRHRAQHRCGRPRQPARFEHGYRLSWGHGRRGRQPRARRRRRPTWRSRRDCWRSARSPAHAGGRDGNCNQDDSGAHYGDHAVQSSTSRYSRTDGSVGE